MVNVAPMELVDLPALVKRLQKGDITFIFDHPDEMDKKDVETLAKQEIFVANLKNFLSGSPTNQVS